LSAPQLALAPPLPARLRRGDLLIELAGRHRLALRNLP
jgi:hypothetical protein